MSKYLKSNVQILVCDYYLTLAVYSSWTLKPQEQSQIFETGNQNLQTFFLVDVCFLAFGCLQGCSSSLCLEGGGDDGVQAMWESVMHVSHQTRVMHSTHYQWATRPEPRITQCRCKYPLLLPENLTLIKRNQNKIYFTLQFKSK